MYDALHIGLHKCASTYLQRTCLAAHPEIDLVWAEQKRFFFELIDYGFDFNVAAFRRTIETTPLKNPKPDATVRVFSHEALCGQMLTGAGARLAADLCCAALGPVKAFVVVREPYSMIYSCWNNYIRGGGVLSLKGFLTSRASPACPTLRRRDNIWKKVCYHHLIRYWQKQVGEERFGVFLLEDLIADVDAFTARLYCFIGVDPEFRPPRERKRLSLPYAVANMKRLANHLVETAGNPAGILPGSVKSKFRRNFNRLGKRWPTGKKPDVQALVPADIRAEIAAANRELAALLGRDLAPLGYDV